MGQTHARRITPGIGCSGYELACRGGRVSGSLEDIVINGFCQMEEGTPR